jgi:hypothetical protein
MVPFFLTKQRNQRTSTLFRFTPTLPPPDRPMAPPKGTYASRFRRWVERTKPIKGLPEGFYKELEPIEEFAKELEKSEVESNSFSKRFEEIEKKFMKELGDVNKRLASVEKELHIHKRVLDVRQLMVVFEKRFIVDTFGLNGQWTRSTFRNCYQLYCGQRLDGQIMSKDDKQTFKKSFISWFFQTEPTDKELSKRFAEVDTVIHDLTEVQDDYWSDEENTFLKVWSDTHEMVFMRRTFWIPSLREVCL